MPTLRVDSARLWKRLMDLARHGARADGGVDRQALSDPEIPARAELVGWGRAAGLRPFTDALGNLFLRLEGREPALAPVLVGSHIDSQPTGGKFDGPLGVLAALAAVEAIREAGVKPRRPIEVVAWMNEEGSRFAPGMMGSAGYVGARPLDAILAVTDRAGKTVREEVAKLLAADRDIPARPLGRAAAAFLEAHIEQGPLLEQAGIPIGIVTTMLGKRTFRVRIVGEEAHAGTTPRARRKDALVAAVAIIAELQSAIWDEADTVRFTIGRLTVTPNAPSVVPGEVEFSIDLRHGDPATLKRTGNAVATVAKAHAGPCRAEVIELLNDAPIAFPAEMRQLIAAAARASGHKATEIVSNANHDARHLAGFCPTGLLFIPCKAGISHHPAESILPEHAAAAAEVLAEALAVLAEKPD